MPGTLYLVATPIGNLGDITSRALETLKRVGFLACEDTRHTRVLLEHFGISADTVSLPAFAEGQRAGRILDRIAAGEDCALVTDAGSPGISDPGEKLVAEAIERGIAVVPVPGATALVSALSASGLPASVTSAQSSPASSRSRMRPARCPSAKAGRLTVSAAMPKCSNSTRECRVSSQATKPTWRSVSRARVEMSPRFPMGVATR